MYDTSFFEDRERKYFKDLDFESIVNFEVQKKELIIDFYRIGVKLPFTLPITNLKKDMPVGILNRTFYPYNIWISWELKKRFEILYYGNKISLLTNELEALSKFSSYTNENDDVSLCTAHFAEIFAFYIRHNISNDVILNGAERLISVLISYYNSNWKDISKMADKNLMNIPCIILIALSNLANALNHERKKEFSNKVILMFDYWHRRRLCNPPYSEGVAYDCYFLNSFLEWSDSSINKNYKNSLLTVYESILNQALNTKEEILAPIGDVEPHMTFFIDVFYKISNEFQLDNSIIENMNLDSIPIYTLVHYKRNTLMKQAKKSTITCNAIVLNSENIQLIVSYPMCETGHLHFDAGNFVLGVFGNFFITDPGYQQYSFGEEREYTISAFAHNTPIINELNQTKKCSEILNFSDDNLILDISNCYENNLSVKRSFEIENSKINIYDEINGDFEKLKYSFYLGTNILIYEKDNSLILKNNLGAIQISESNIPLSYKNIRKISGSRGPLNLYFSSNVPLNLKIEII